MTTNQVSPARPSLPTVLYQSAILVFLLAFVLLMYTALHESGHAAVGVLSGGILTDFNANFIDLSAHVGIRGDFSVLQNALIAAAGVSLPIVVWAIFSLLITMKSNPVSRMLGLIGGLASINSLLAWIVIPWLVMAGQSPADDSANFLRITGIYPPLVSGAALLVWAGGWTLLIRRNGGLRGIWECLRQPAAAFLSAASKTTLLVLAGLFCLTAAATAFLGTQSNGNAQMLPGGYSKVAEVKLADGAIQQQSVYTFTLEQPTTVSFYFILPRLSTGPAEIVLAGPGNYHNTFFRAPETFQGSGTVNPTGLNLEAGAYEIRMTFPQVNGQVDVGRK